MEIAFWIALGLIFYCYAGYPALIWLLSRLMARPVRRGDFLPTVSVLISVWNEEDVIEARIRNLRELDYPADKINFYIGSDHSTDRTDELIRGFHDPRLHLVVAPERRGKMMMLNDLAAVAGGEIFVFADARQTFANDAIRQLVMNFADEKIGCVSGELIFQHQEGFTAKGIDLYWRYEKFIRAAESRLHSMLGATGAICAIRKDLFTSLPSDMVLDDMFIPFQIILKGHRAIVDESARAYDLAAEDPNEEFRRKVRTLYGNYQIFAALPGMFLPWRSPVAVQLFSHKFLRLMVPFLMAVVFFSNAGLPLGGFYCMIFGVQLVFYALALTGWLAKGRKHAMVRVIQKISYVPYVFCLLNIAALAGFWRFVAGAQKVTWEKAREKNVS